ncbi:MAG TPA: hypothetical protein VK638_19495, partial [Edaphobacter sp.]|nr:hypothetical protein [Edaphobacter sp.]
ETGSNRRRRPFQGLLLIALSRLESADITERQEFSAVQKVGKKSNQKYIFGTAVYPLCTLFGN